MFKKNLIITEYTRIEEVSHITVPQNLMEDSKELVCATPSPESLINNTQEKMIVLFKAVVTKVVVVVY